MYKKQIPYKLQQNLNVSIAQSQLAFEESAHHPNQSFIHQLDDLNFENSNPTFFAKESTAQIKQNIKHSEKKIQEMIGTKAIAKFNKVHQSMIKTSPTISSKHMIFSHDKDNPLLKKIRQQQEKSTTIRLKDFIYNELFPDCSKCSKKLSQFNSKGLVCSDCSRTSTTYPLFGVLYQFQYPSCSYEILKEILKELDNQLNKLEKLKNNLLIAKGNLQKIIQLQAFRQDRNWKQIIRKISNLRKDIRINGKDSIINSEISSLFNQDYLPYFQEFLLWNQLSLSSNSLFDDLRKSINDQKPLCLKEPTTQMLPYINNVTNNFNNIELRISISDQIPSGFNFSGLIDNLTIIVDGSMSLSRQSLLLIEKINKLRIQFKSKKTSRELKQLFYLLPQSYSLEFEFDYRNNTHISSEAFPILLKACERQCDQLFLRIKNAREEILKEILTASRCITYKKKLSIQIQMNPFIDIKNSYDEQYGSAIIENLLKGVSNEVISIDLKVPLFIDYERIYEHIMNHDYSKLIGFKLQGLNGDKNEMMSTLCQSILRKKYHFIGLLKNKDLDPQFSILKKFKILRNVLNLLIV